MVSLACLVRLDITTKLLVRTSSCTRLACLGLVTTVFSATRSTLKTTVGELFMTMIWFLISPLWLLWAFSPVLIITEWKPSTAKKLPAWIPHTKMSHNPYNEDASCSFFQGIMWSHSIEKHKNTLAFRLEHSGRQIVFNKRLKDAAVEVRS